VYGFFLKIVFVSFVAFCILFAELIVAEGAKTYAGEAHRPPRGSLSSLERKSKDNIDR